MCRTALVFHNKTSILSGMKRAFRVIGRISFLLLVLILATGCAYGPFSSQRLDELHVSGSVTPNDPRYSDQEWYLQAIRAPQAWFFLQTIQDRVKLQDVRVAVIDTSYQLDHADLVGAFVIEEQYDAVKNINKISKPIPDEKHGTHVAGLIGAIGDNEVGITGAALNSENLKKVSIIPIVALPSSGIGSEDGVVRAIYRSTHSTSGNIPTITGGRADIINMSLGGIGEASPILRGAVQSAQFNGIVLIAASGNKNRTSIDFPASIPEVIAVGSVSKSANGQWVRSSFSNYASATSPTAGGVRLDLVAPGGSAPGSEKGILSTIIGDSYDRKKGTSMATPLVSAAAALIRSVNPNLSPNQVRQILVETAQKIWQIDGHPDRRYLDTEWQDWHPMYGYGMVDMDAAVKRAYQSYVFASSSYSIYDEDLGRGESPALWLPTGPLTILVSLDLENATAREVVDARNEIRDYGFSVWESGDGTVLTIRVPADYPGQLLLDHLNALPGVGHATQAQPVSF
jgi:subtilisin family serine protease